VSSPPYRKSLRVVPISKMRPHEETVQSLAETLGRSLRDEGVQRDPVILDEATGTILDGTHRAEALRRAGAKSVLAFLVDYHDPQVKLYRWCRFVKEPAESAASAILNELGLERFGTSPRETLLAHPERLLVTYRGESFRRSEATVEDEIGLMRKFDVAASRLSLKVEFVDEAVADNATSGAADLFLFPPKFGKADVLRAAAEGRLFPPKSTLHVFPYRPLGVGYPLEELLAGRDVLDEVLGSRQPKLLEESTNHRGRNYRERVLVFE